MTPTPDPFFRLTGSGITWCYAGARLEPAANGGTAAGVTLSEEQHRAKTVEQERTWLAAHWATDGRCWEVRYRTPGTDDGGSSCLLLGRAHGTTWEEAHQAAEAMRESMCAPPRHVSATALTGPEVQRALQPFAGVPAYLVEIRKRISWDWIRRSGAPFPIGVVVEPFTTQPVDWEPVWAEMGRVPGAVVLAVRLEPVAWYGDHAETVRKLIREYRLLAQPGRLNPAIGRQEPAVPFAARAAAYYEQLLDGMAERSYRLRITLAADRVVPPQLAEVVAAPVSEPHPTTTGRGPAGDLGR